MSVRFPDNADDGLDNVVLPGGAALAAREVNPEATPLPQELLSQPAPQPQISITQLPQPQAQAADDDGFDVRRLMHTLGGGTALDYDKFKAGQRESELNNQYKRQLMQGQSMDLEDRQQERQLKSQELRDSLVPHSQLSQSTAAEFSRLNQARAEMLADKSPRLAEMFRQAAEGAAGRSRMEIMRAGASLDSLWSNFTGMMDSESKSALAKQNMDLKKMGVQAQLSNAAATRELAAQKAADVKQEKEDKQDSAYNKDKAPLNEFNSLLKQAKDQKKKTNTGPIISRAQKVAAWVGLKGADFTQLEALQSTVNNAITKLQSGGNVTDGEADRLRQQLAMLDQDDEEFDIKLNQMLETISLKIDEVDKQHPAAVRRAKAKQSESPSQLSAQDQKALNWANSHASDPRAAEIKKRLGVK